MEKRIFERTTLIDQIVNDVKGRIIAREFKEGDLLPSQDEMARRLGVSRVSLREAFNRLALMGLIEIKHGVGTYIKATKPEYLINSISSMIVMDQASADELLQARLVRFFRFDHHFSSLVNIHRGGVVGHTGVIIAGN